MKSVKKPLRTVVAVAAIATAVMANPVNTNAMPPVLENDEGAFVRLVGNPADGTAKFQFGWSRSTPASDAAGYWVGLYDVTNSTYVWSTETGAVELPDQLKRNAHPTAYLPNGEYKVMFFVRETYVGPVTNIAEIELPFTVNYDDMME